MSGGCEHDVLTTYQGSFHTWYMFRRALGRAKGRATATRWADDADKSTITTVREKWAASLPTLPQFVLKTADFIIISGVRQTAPIIISYVHFGIMEIFNCNEYAMYQCQIKMVCYSLGIRVRVRVRVLSLCSALTVLIFLIGSVPHCTYPFIKICPQVFFSVLSCSHAETDECDQSGKGSRLNCVQDIYVV